MSEVHAGSREQHLMDHTYDGIQEYDNPTPGWWHVVFLGSVVFSFFYLVFWHGSPMAWTNEQAWAADSAAATKRLFGKMGDVQADEAGILKLMGNSDLMAYGQGTFVTNCAACHGRDGGGINGVNLTDDSYKNVKKLTDLYKVITEGAAQGAMPAWRTNFSDKERVLLAAYVATLRGKNLGGRPAEGEVIPPWPKGGA